MDSPRDWCRLELGALCFVPPCLVQMCGLLLSSCLQSSAFPLFAAGLAPGQLCFIKFYFKMTSLDNPQGYILADIQCKRLKHAVNFLSRTRRAQIHMFCWLMILLRSISLINKINNQIPLVLLLALHKMECTVHYLIIFVNIHHIAMMENIEEILSAFTSIFLL